MAIKKREPTEEERKEIEQIKKENENLKQKIESITKEKAIVKIIKSFYDRKDLAEQFIETQPLFYDEFKNWWLWNENRFCWVLTDETDLLNLISENSFANTIRSKDKNEIIEALKQVGRLNKPKESPKTWIQFNNVIVDIKTKQQFKANPEYFITNPIPWKLGISKDTPTIDKIFSDWMQGESNSWKDTLSELCAYCLLPDYPLHIIFALLGKGCNGKGSFMRMIEKFVGSNNTASSDIELISDVQSERAKIYKKLVCNIGEIDKGIFKQTKWLKRLSGDDTTPMRDLYKKSMDFRNYAKIILAANKLPSTPDKSQGFFRRWVCIDFKNQFENKGKKIEDTIPDVEFENLAFKCIDILYNLLEKGKFTNQGTIEDQEARYEDRASPILEFINKYYELDSKSHIRYSTFYDEYISYLFKEKLPQISKKEFSHMLEVKGYQKKNITIKQGDSTTTTDVVIGLKDMQDKQNVF